MILEYPALTGAALGLAGGLGACLIVWRLAARRVRLVHRVAPYLRERPSTSRLLTTASTVTPFPTLERMLRPLATDAAGLLERIGSPASTTRRRLARAGLSLSVEQFRIEQLIWASLGLVAGLLLALLLAATRGSGIVALAVLVLLATIGGALARDQALTRQISRREQTMVAEFPTVAELLALAVGAGETPLAALDRVASSMRGELAEEIRITLADIRSGIALTQALERMADRTELPSIARFTEGVAVAVERGTPLGEVLRAQAEDAREVGHRALMEAGGRKEVYMMIPVVFLMLPVTVLFAIFPGLSVLQVGL
ncbi:MAG TPA: type II secretion system F family protein [Beutenbergiaceae bacterium]|nr:type II secretion system F family protein [Beutenbergiaceae bacterium]